MRMLKMAPKDKAREYWERGFTLIPCKGKRPIVAWRDYAEDGVPDELMEAWLEDPKYASCNWAIITGLESVVADADSEEAIAWCEANLPFTPLRVRTGRGMHYYFRADLEDEIRNAVNENAKIDIRGRGGIVVAPGSIHENGRIYEELWADGFDQSLDELPLFDRETLRKIAHYNNPNEAPQAPSPSQVTDINLDALVIPEGGREKALIQIAGVRYREGWSLEQVIQELVEVNAVACRPSLPRQDIIRISNSILNTHHRNEARQDKILTEKLQTAAQDAANRLQPIIFELCDDIDTPVEVLRGRGYPEACVSLITAGGGTGKSLVLLADALAMASGRDFMGYETERQRVLYLCLEDTVDEVQRRAKAIAARFGLSREDISPNFMIVSDEAMFRVAELKGEQLVMTPDLPFIAEFIESNEIDVLMVDPFVRAHRARENDNGQMDAITGEFALVAKRTGCSVVLAHHVNKASGVGGPSANDSRGASSVNDAARFALRLSKMTEEESKQFADIEDHSKYVRLTMVKGNNLPPGGADQWFRLESVDIPGNQQRGVPVPVELAKSSIWDGITTEMLEMVQTRVRMTDVKHGKTLRADDQDGIKWLIQNVCGFEDSARAWRLFEEWERNGALAVEERRDAHRNKRKFVTVGKMDQIVASLVGGQ